LQQRTNMYQNHTLNTAILVFANSSQEEVKHKAITQGRNLFDVLTANTLKTVEKTGLPYFHFTEEQQIGDTFGERFSHAIQAIYDKGYSQVITIGNDSPMLKASHILEAEKRIKTNQFVLGPSIDGGFYLMGLHKNQFNTKAFQQLPWQTAGLSKQLEHLIASSAKAFRLPALLDIDSIADVKSCISYALKISNTLYKILHKILSKPLINIPFTRFSYVNIHFKLSYNKGSPFLLQYL